MNLLDVAYGEASDAGVWARFCSILFKINIVVHIAEFGDSRPCAFRRSFGGWDYNFLFYLHVSFDSSVGRARDCNWKHSETSILRSLVRSRLEG